MKIVADRDIFNVEAYFSSLGELELLPGREISGKAVKDADALLVRTVTRVDRDLTQNSSLKFVGSASSGFDHVDRQWLETAGIHFAHAPGCNADAVMNYVVAVLAWLSVEKNTDWRQWSVGIIGAGNVGGRVGLTLKSLGMTVAVFDPFLPDSHPLADEFTSLENVLKQDVITLHTPLTTTGPHPTRHLLNGPVLESLTAGTMLINAARGEVVNNSALDALLKKGKALTPVLDVWEGEPEILPSLAASVAIATPHIAGYSLHGKLNATVAIQQALCQTLSLSFTGRRFNSMPRVLEVADTDSETAQLNQSILQAYPINRDFLIRKKRAEQSVSARQFDQLRNNYTFRPEFRDCQIRAEAIRPSLERDLEKLGFRLI